MRVGATILALLAASAAALIARADEQIAEIRQGTNIGLAIAPSGDTLVVDVLDQLWKLPATGGGAEPLTPPGQSARNPRYSPDGGLVVYQRFIDAQWDLWLLDINTGVQRALTATPYNEREPDFTADGGSIVFAADQTGHYCLWALALGSGVLTQLTEEPGDAAFPTVSEHGLIAYVLDHGGQSTLRVLAGTGVSAALHASANKLTAPSWRPGGGVLVFGEQAGTGLSRLRMLLLTEPRVQKPLSGDEDLFRTRPAWASEAEFIYAADGQLWRRGIAHPVRQPVHLFTAVAVETRSPPTDLRPLDEHGPHPALGIDGAETSADGRRTVFTALGDLWLLERNHVERLSDDVFVEIDPTFWPDGESVVFASERGGQPELWRLALRDRRVTQLTFGAVRPHGPAVSPDGNRIAFLETDGLGPWAPARLAVLDLTNRGGEATIVALDVVGAARPSWSADGRTLSVRAKAARPTGESLGRSMPIRVEVITNLAGPPAPTRGGPGAGLNVGGPPGIELTWQPPPPPSDYMVQVGRLFDGVRGDYRRHIDLHIRRGRIAAIVSRGTLPAPASVIDARDATVLPGFIDIHAHQSALAGERLGRAWLAYGVTTVREIAADLPEALARGEAWASGRLPGPRLVITPDAAAAEPAEGMLGSIVPIRRYPGLADGFGHSLLRQARQLAIPDFGSVRGYPRSLESGSTGARYELEVSPSYSAYQDGLSRLIASGTVLAPALGALGGIGSWPRLNGRTAGPDAGYRALFTPAEQAVWTSVGPAAAAVPALQDTIARLIRGGGRVAVGTDTPAVPYGLGVHLELAVLAGAGVANDQVLRLATAGGALALGLEQQIGTLQEGKLADFIVIDGDPLTRLPDSLRITAVIKGGMWFDRETLLKRP